MHAISILLTLAVLGCLASIMAGRLRRRWHAVAGDDLVRVAVFAAWAILVVLLYEVRVGLPFRELAVDVAVRRALAQGSQAVAPVPAENRGSAPDR